MYYYGDVYGISQKTVPTNNRTHKIITDGGRSGWSRGLDVDNVRSQLRLRVENGAREHELAGSVKPID